MKKMTVEKAKAELQTAMSGPAGRHWNYGPAVSAVLEALEQAEQRIAELEKWVRGVEESMICASDRAEAAEKRSKEHRRVLNNLAAVARRYLPDYDEHPDIQVADNLLEKNELIAELADGTHELYAAQPAPDFGDVRVGRLPTMNQDEYPGLGDWWVQLRIGEDSEEVLARVYGATAQEAKNRAEALAYRAAMHGATISNPADFAIEEISKVTAPVSMVVPEDYFSSLVSKARPAAEKAMRKFPQPNYVLLKVAEEAGEVVQAGVHYAERRMSWEQVEGEIVQLLAMLIRLVTEGDQINGVTPPEHARAAAPRQEAKQ